MTGKNERLAWLEANKNPPTYFRTHHKISLEEFERKVHSYDRDLTDSLYAGDAYIIQGVY